MPIQKWGNECCNYNIKEKTGFRVYRSSFNQVIITEYPWQCQWADLRRSAGLSAASRTSSHAHEFPGINMIHDGPHTSQFLESISDSLHVLMTYLNGATKSNAILILGIIGARRLPMIHSIIRCASYRQQFPESMISIWIRSELIYWATTRVFPSPKVVSSLPGASIPRQANLSVKRSAGARASESPD